MKSTVILDLAAEYIVQLYNERLASNYLYHDITHTKMVFETCSKIAKGIGLSAEDQEIVLLAAWFHDAGIIYGLQDHEEKSCEIAREFLSSHNFDENKTEKVCSCILATKLPQNPEDRLAMVLCDADLIHIGKKNYWERMNLLRTEFERVSDRVFTDLEWFQDTVNVFAANQFHLEYTKERFGKRRTENFLELQERLRREILKIDNTANKMHLQQEKLAIQKEKQSKPERGIETMFKITMHNHMQLSQMADSKAHIMISVNTILISIVVSFLIRKIDSNPHLLIPAVLILIVALGSIIMAVLVTKPHISSGKFTPDDVAKKKVNLLFFGNFYNMGLPEFDSAMKSMLDDKDYLYSSMIKDLYFLGKVLGKKYKLINWCYQFFMYGMIIAVIAFIIAIAFHPGPTTLNMD